MSNLTNKIKISNDSIIREFKQHLNLEFNHRILFTAPFGVGKSTFINDFQESHQQEYRFVKLYPVNYAVSANEDIFELIKFDILYELMANYQYEIALVKEDFDFWLRMSMFMQNKASLMPLFLHIISLHETIGKPVAKFIEVIKPLINDFRAYTKEVNIDESADVFAFLQSFESKKGSPYEMDATSQFVYDLIDRLKGKELPNEVEVKQENKIREYKTVLVIDDLDRLDPDHIFRLFNIFSAHTHSITGENKFGFDKVIFVCDIENIRKIYAHKYGVGVDFSGYMDKFYSVKPFEFDNVRYINEVLHNILPNYYVTVKEKYSVDIINCQEYYIDKNYQCLFSAVIKIFLKYRLLNLRTVINMKDMRALTDFERKYQGRSLYSENYLLLKIFYLMEQLMGGQRNLEDALEIISRGKEIIYSNNLKLSVDFNIKAVEYQCLKTEILKSIICPSKVYKSERTDKFKGVEIMLSYGFNGVEIDKVMPLEPNQGGNIIELMHYDVLLFEAYKKLQEYEFIPILSTK